MRTRILLPLLQAFFLSLTQFTPALPAGIVWGTDAGAGAKYGWYTWSEFVPGTRVPGGPIDLSNGALVQLYKAVGAIDDPRGVMEAYQSTSWVIDDVLLDTVHVGYGLGPPGAPANGEWSRTTNVDIAIGDVLYARIYNLPLADWEAGFGERGVGIRDTGYAIIEHTVATVDTPQTYYFDNMFIQIIPEPAAFALLLTGLAFWAFTSRRRPSAKATNKR